MKKFIAAIVLLVAGLSFNAHAASMSCSVIGKPANESNCIGVDFTFGRAGTVTFSINPMGETVENVIWIGGCIAPQGAMQCTTTIYSYNPLTARAVLLKPGQTYEEVSATAYYETGY